MSVSTNANINGGCAVTAITPALSPTGDNTAAVSSIISTMTAGQTLLLPVGSYRLDITTTKGIKIYGSATPGYLAGSLVGGTIIKGTISIQDAVGAEVAFLGIDQTSLTPGSYPNAISGGTSTINDSTTVMNQYVHDVVCLGRGFASSQNSQHGILFQNGRGFLAERCSVYKYLNMFISRASGATFSNCYGQDSEANIVLFKSESTGGSNDAYDNTAINVIGKATADGFFANFTSLAQDAGGIKVTRNSKFIGCTADATGTTTGQSVFMAVGAVNAGSNRATQFVGCTSKGDRSGNSAFLVYDDFNEGTVFVGCNAEDFGALSFRSTATTASNLPSVIGGMCWRNGFPHIINVAGIWAICEVNGQSFDSGQSRTVATLPDVTKSASKHYIVTDALAPAWNAAVVGGGTITVSVISDGTTWKVG
jgi:hypothetical protein